MTNTFRRFAATALSPALVLSCSRVARAADADEEMLARGVKFLCSHQNADGSFGGARPGEKPGEIGITALAIKALHEWKATDPALEKDAKAVIEKGTAHLLSKQQDDGSITDKGSGLGTYRTSASIMALVAIDKTKYKEQIAKAVKWLESDQFNEENAASKTEKSSPHYGGWGYDSKTGTKPDADLSNTQFAISALKDAGVAADSPVMKRAVEFITRCQNNTETNKGVPEAKLVSRNDGGFFYGPSRATAAQTKIENKDGSVSYESYASMTYNGLLSLACAGLTKEDGRVKAALNWVKEHYTLDENQGLGLRATAPTQAQAGLFYYYLAFARSLSALGADEIDTKSGKHRWARDLLDACKARQKPDGSWNNAEADRWMEGDPSLVTSYVLNAGNIAIKHR
ncbi:hypothetical protein HY251_10135 [bacterium]|nr:hypothetical protein [bacterium]